MDNDLFEITTGPSGEENPFKGSPEDYRNKKVIKKGRPTPQHPMAGKVHKVMGSPEEPEKRVKSSGKDTRFEEMTTRLLELYPTITTWEDRGTLIYVDKETSQPWIKFSPDTIVAVFDDRIPADLMPDTDSILKFYHYGTVNDQRDSEGALLYYPEQREISPAEQEIPVDKKKKLASKSVVLAMYLSMLMGEKIGKGVLPDIQDDRITLTGLESEEVLPNIPGMSLKIPKTYGVIYYNSPEWDVPTVMLNKSTLDRVKNGLTDELVKELTSDMGFTVYEDPDYLSGRTVLLKFPSSMSESVNERLVKYCDSCDRATFDIKAKSCPSCGKILYMQPYEAGDPERGNYTEFHVEGTGTWIWGSGELTRYTSHSDGIYEKYFTEDTEDYTEALAAAYDDGAIRAIDSHTFFMFEFVRPSLTPQSIATLEKIVAGYPDGTRMEFNNIKRPGPDWDVAKELDTDSRDEALQYVRDLRGSSSPPIAPPGSRDRLFGPGNYESINEQEEYSYRKVRSGGTWLWGDGVLDTHHAHIEGLRQRYPDMFPDDSYGPEREAEMRAYGEGSVRLHRTFSSLDMAFDSKKISSQNIDRLISMVRSAADHLKEYEVNAVDSQAAPPKGKRSLMDLIAGGYGIPVFSSDSAEDVEEYLRGVRVRDKSDLTPSSSRFRLFGITESINEYVDDLVNESPREISNEDLEEIFALVDRGLNAVQIARETGKHVTTVRKHLKQFMGDEAYGVWVGDGNLGRGGAAPLSSEETEKILDLYHQGWSNTQIAGEIERSVESVGRALRGLLSSDEYAEVSRWKSRGDEEARDKIRELSRQGVSAVEIGRIVNVAHSTVFKYLKRTLSPEEYEAWLSSPNRENPYNHRPREWSDEESAQVLELLNRGYTAIDISREMGIAYYSMKAYLKKVLGPEDYERQVTRRKQRYQKRSPGVEESVDELLDEAPTRLPLSDEEVEEIIALHDRGLNLDQMSKKMGISRVTARKYLQKFMSEEEYQRWILANMVNSRTAPPLSSDEVGQIMDLYRQGWSLQNIAGELDRASATVSRALRDLLGPKEYAEITRWKPVGDSAAREKIRELFHQGISAASIGRQVRMTGGNVMRYIKATFTPEEIEAWHASPNHNLGTGGTARKRVWSEEDSAKVLELLKSGQSTNAVAKEMGLSKHAIRNHLQQVLGPEEYDRLVTANSSARNRSQGGVRPVEEHVDELLDEDTFKLPNDRVEGIAQAMLAEFINNGYQDIREVFPIEFRGETYDIPISLRETGYVEDDEDENYLYMPIDKEFYDHADFASLYPDIDPGEVAIRLYFPGLMIRYIQSDKRGVLMNPSFERNFVRGLHHEMSHAVSDRHIISQVGTQGSRAHGNRPRIPKPSSKIQTMRPDKKRAKRTVNAVDRQQGLTHQDLTQYDYSPTEIEAQVAEILADYDGENVNDLEDYLQTRWGDGGWIWNNKTPPGKRKILKRLVKELGYQTRESVNEQETGDEYDFDFSAGEEEPDQRSDRQQHPGGMATRGARHSWYVVQALAPLCRTERGVEIFTDSTHQGDTRYVMAQEDVAAWREVMGDVMQVGLLTSFLIECYGTDYANGRTVGTVIVARDNLFEDELDAINDKLGDLGYVVTETVPRGDTGQFTDIWNMDTGQVTDIWNMEIDAYEPGDFDLPQESINEQEMGDEYEFDFSSGEEPSNEVSDADLLQARSTLRMRGLKGLMGRHRDDYDVRVMVNLSGSFSQLIKISTPNVICVSHKFLSPGGEEADRFAVDKTAFITEREAATAVRRILNWDYVENEIVDRQMSYFYPVGEQVTDSINEQETGDEYEFDFSSPGGSPVRDELTDVELAELHEAARSLVSTILMRNRPGDTVTISYLPTGRWDMYYFDEPDESPLVRFFDHRSRGWPHHIILYEEPLRRVGGDEIVERIELALGGIGYEAYRPGMGWAMPYYIYLRPRDLETRPEDEEDEDDDPNPGDVDEATLREQETGDEYDFDFSTPDDGPVRRPLRPGVPGHVAPIVRDFLRILINASPYRSWKVTSRADDLGRGTPYSMISTREIGHDGPLSKWAVDFILPEVQLREYEGGRGGLTELEMDLLVDYLENAGATKTGEEMDDIYGTRWHTYILPHETQMPGPGLTLDDFMGDWNREVTQGESINEQETGDEYDLDFAGPGSEPEPDDWYEQDFAAEVFSLDGAVSAFVEWIPGNARKIRFPRVYQVHVDDRGNENRRVYLAGFYPRGHLHSPNEAWIQARELRERFNIGSQELKEFMYEIGYEPDTQCADTPSGIRYFVKRDIGESINEQETGEEYDFDFDSGVPDEPGEEPGQYAGILTNDRYTYQRRWAFIHVPEWLSGAIPDTVRSYEMVDDKLLHVDWDDPAYEYASVYVDIRNPSRIEIGLNYHREWGNSLAVLEVALSDSRYELVDDDRDGRFRIWVRQLEDMGEPDLPWNDESINEQETGEEYDFDFNSDLQDEPADRRPGPMTTEPTAGRVNDEWPVDWISPDQATEIAGLVSEWFIEFGLATSARMLWQPHHSPHFYSMLKAKIGEHTYSVLEFFPARKKVFIPLSFYEEEIFGYEAEAAVEDIISDYGFRYQGPFDNGLEQKRVFMHTADIVESLVEQELGDEYDFDFRLAPEFSRVPAPRPREVNDAGDMTQIEVEENIKALMSWVMQNIRQDYKYDPEGADPITRLTFHSPGEDDGYNSMHMRSGIRQIKIGINVERDWEGLDDTVYRYLEVMKFTELPRETGGRAAPFRRFIREEFVPEPPRGEFVPTPIVREQVTEDIDKIVRPNGTWIWEDGTMTQHRTHEDGIAARFPEQYREWSNLQGWDELWDFMFEQGSIRANYYAESLGLEFSFEHVSSAALDKAKDIVGRAPIDISFTVNDYGRMNTKGTFKADFLTRERGEALAFLTDLRAGDTDPKIDPGDARSRLFGPGIYEQETGEEYDFNFFPDPPPPAALAEWHEMVQASLETLRSFERDPLVTYAVDSMDGYDHSYYIFRKVDDGDGNISAGFVLKFFYRNRCVVARTTRGLFGLSWSYLGQMKRVLHDYGYRYEKSDVLNDFSWIEFRPVYTTEESLLEQETGEEYDFDFRIPGDRDKPSRPMITSAYAYEVVSTIKSRLVMSGVPSDTLDVRAVYNHVWMLSHEHSERILVSVAHGESNMAGEAWYELPFALDMPDHPEYDVRDTPLEDGVEAVLNLYGWNFDHVEDVTVQYKIFVHDGDPIAESLTEQETGDEYDFDFSVPGEPRDGGPDPEEVIAPGMTIRNLRYAKGDAVFFQGLISRPDIKTVMGPSLFPVIYVVPNHVNAGVLEDLEHSYLAAVCPRDHPNFPAEVWVHRGYLDQDQWERLEYGLEARFYEYDEYVDSDIPIMVFKRSEFDQQHLESINEQEMGDEYDFDFSIPGEEKRQSTRDRWSVTRREWVPDGDETGGGRTIEPNRSTTVYRTNNTQQGVIGDQVSENLLQMFRFVVNNVQELDPITFEPPATHYEGLYQVAFGGGDPHNGGVSMYVGIDERRVGINAYAPWPNWVYQAVTNTLGLQGFKQYAATPGMRFDIYAMPIENAESSSSGASNLFEQETGDEYEFDFSMPPEKEQWSYGGGGRSFELIWSADEVFNILSDLVAELPGGSTEFRVEQHPDDIEHQMAWIYPVDGAALVGHISGRSGVLGMIVGGDKLSEEDFVSAVQIGLGDLGFYRLGATERADEITHGVGARWVNYAHLNHNGRYDVGAQDESLTEQETGEEYDFDFSPSRGYSEYDDDDDELIPYEDEGEAVEPPRPDRLTPWARDVFGFLIAAIGEDTVVHWDPDAEAEHGEWDLNTDRDHLFAVHPWNESGWGRAEHAFVPGYDLAEFTAFLDGEGIPWYLDNEDVDDPAFLFFGRQNSVVISNRGQNESLEERRVFKADDGLFDQVLLWVVKNQTVMADTNKDLQGRDRSKVEMGNVVARQTFDVGFEGKTYRVPMTILNSGGSRMHGYYMAQQDYDRIQATPETELSYTDKKGKDIGSVPTEVTLELPKMTVYNATAPEPEPKKPVSGLGIDYYGDVNNRSFNWGGSGEQEDPGEVWNREALLWVAEEVYDTMVDSYYDLLNEIEDQVAYEMDYEGWDEDIPNSPEYVGRVLKEWKHVVEEVLEQYDDRIPKWLVDELKRSFHYEILMGSAASVAHNLPGKIRMRIEMETVKTGGIAGVSDYGSYYDDDRIPAKQREQGEWWIGSWDRIGTFKSEADYTFDTLGGKEFLKNLRRHVNHEVGHFVYFTQVVGKRDDIYKTVTGAPGSTHHRKGKAKGTDWVYNFAPSEQEAILAEIMGELGDVPDVTTLQTLLKDQDGYRMLDAYGKQNMMKRLVKAYGFTQRESLEEQEIGDEYDFDFAVPDSDDTDGREIDLGGEGELFQGIEAEQTVELHTVDLATASAICRDLKSKMEEIDDVSGPYAIHHNESDVWVADNNHSGVAGVSYIGGQIGDPVYWIAEEAWISRMSGLTNLEQRRIAMFFAGWGFQYHAYDGDMYYFAQWNQMDEARNYSSLSDDEKKRILGMVKRGYTLEKISDAVGRSRATVLLFVKNSMDPEEYKAKYTDSKHELWMSDEDVEEIVGMSKGGMTARQISDKTGRSYTTVHGVLTRKLGAGSSSSASHLSDEEDERILELFHQGLTLQEIADEVGRGYGAVRRTVRSGLSPEDYRRAVTARRGYWDKSDPDYKKLQVPTGVVTRDESLEEQETGEEYEFSFEPPVPTTLSGSDVPDDTEEGDQAHTFMTEMQDYIWMLGQHPDYSVDFVHTEWYDAVSLLVAGSQDMFIWHSVVTTIYNRPDGPEQSSHVNLRYLEPEIAEKVFSFFATKGWSLQHTLGDYRVYGPGLAPQESLEEQETGEEYDFQFRTDPEAFSTTVPEVIRWLADKESTWNMEFDELLQDWVVVDENDNAAAVFTRDGLFHLDKRRMNEAFLASVVQDLTRSGWQKVYADSGNLVMLRYQTLADQGAEVQIPPVPDTAGPFTFQVDPQNVRINGEPLREQEIGDEYDFDFRSGKEFGGREEPSHPMPAVTPSITLRIYEMAREYDRSVRVIHYGDETAPTLSSGYSIYVPSDMGPTVGTEEELFFIWDADSDVAFREGTIQKVATGRWGAIGYLWEELVTGVARYLSEMGYSLTSEDDGNRYFGSPNHAGCMTDCQAECMAGREVGQ